jgi:hypothetical protein
MAASMSLALFAMSFVHFGSAHAVQAWSGELVVHHAGIPLALFVLLQDYRFVLLDAFVRFLANALLAAVLTWLMIEALFRAKLVERVVTSQSVALLTGDTSRTAESVAKAVGIERVFAGVLPAGKADVVRQLQADGTTQEDVDRQILEAIARFVHSLL